MKLSIIGDGVPTLGRNDLKIMLDDKELTYVSELRLTLSRTGMPEAEITITPTDLEVDVEAIMLLNAHVEFEREDERKR